MDGTERRTLRYILRSQLVILAAMKYENHLPSRIKEDAEAIIRDTETMDLLKELDK